jgi:ornithine cyclodeaminase/alanine dehydrogenase-like protein (mu-crystallin family)
MTIILSNDDVARVLTVPECMAALEDAYAELGAGRGVNRTRSDTLAGIESQPGALYSLKSMDGIAPKFGVGAVRINSDVVTWPKRGNNQRREKVPAAGGRWVGLVLLFSAETGEPLAIFPDGVLQRIRVASANGIAAKYMAREDATRVGLLGSGWQAGTQLVAVCAARKIERIRCFSPSPENRAKFAIEMTPQLGVEVEPVASAEDAIEGADVVMCATNSIDPIYFESWIAPGVHVSSIKRPEIDQAALKRADRLVIHTHDSKPMHFTTHELEIPEAVSGKGWNLVDEIDFAKLPTIGELVTGRYRGRNRPEDVTMFINNLGMGYQFAAAGSVVYRKAREQGLGHELPTEWFTEDVHP